MAGEYQEQWNSSWIDRDCNLVSQEIVEWRLEIAHLPQMKSRDKIHNDKAPGTDVGARSRQTDRQKTRARTPARPINYILKCIQIDKIKNMTLRNTYITEQ